MADKKALKIAFFHNVCAPYRIPLFERISKLPGIDLKVYFGRFRSSHRTWNVDLNFDFKYEMVGEIRALERFFDNPVNPFFIFKLLSKKFDSYIGGVPHYFGTILTFLIAKMLRKPFILFLENVDHPIRTQRSRLQSFLDSPLKKKLIEMTSFIMRNTLGKMVLKHSDAYVAPGIATKEYLLRKGIARHKIFIAANAVDNEFFEHECEELQKKKKPEKLKKKLGLENKKIILCVSHLNEIKGIQYLIPAFAKLRREKNNIALVIVGDGPYKQELMNTCKKNEVDAIFTGYIPGPGPDLINHYLIADVFVLPTLRDVWGFVINEAMICGCPIITTVNAGASRDLVKNGVNGYVIQPNSSLQIYHALKDILNDIKITRRMGEKSVEIIQNYCYDKSVKGFKLAIEYATSKVTRKHDAPLHLSTS